MWLLGTDQFLPVYKEIYGFLEMQTLPHFLSYAQTNINLPKQVFWSVSPVSFLYRDLVRLGLSLSTHPEHAGTEWD